MLELKTDEFNREAEHYFAAYPDPDRLLDKPFSEPEFFSQRLIDVGVLVDGLRLRPGDVVLELGAGTCWLSHLLNRYGCKTIVVDVSPTALSMGRSLFERDPRTNWHLEPEFHVYDGHTLPLDAGTVDRVVLYDAFHHIPNPWQLLGEMRRVLRPNGIVAMSEPGRGHSTSPSSLAETAATGVLENELALEEIAERALASGFVAARVILSGRPPSLLEIDARDLRPFMGGRSFGRYWKNLCTALDSHHYILLFAGDPEPTTRRPKRLVANIRRIGPRRALQISRGKPIELMFDVHNAGDTHWLRGENAAGWTRFGAHLYHSDRTLVDYDWVRASLPQDVAPEQNVHLVVTLPAIQEPGNYLVVCDLVIEGATWFAERGTRPLEVPCRVV